MHFIYTHIYCWCQLPNQLFGCHSRTMRVSEQRTTWGVGGCIGITWHWHVGYLSWVKVIGDPSPGAKVMLWPMMIYWFFFWKNAMTESHTFVMKVHQMLNMTFDCVSVFFENHIKKDHLVKVSPQLSPSLFGDRRSRRKQTQERSNEIPPQKKKIRSRSLSPPSSEVEVGELGKNVTNRPRGCMEYVCICMVSSVLANGWALICLGLHI